MGLFGVAKGCKRLMNLYFALALCFTAVQVGHAVIGFISGPSWIQEALENSWDKAYESDKRLIRELQNELHCQGFQTQDDRGIEMPLGPQTYLPPCAEILQARFGRRLQRLGSMILCIRLIQMTGVFLLSILFQYLAESEKADKSDQDQDQDQDSAYFRSEKQIEDEYARIPLLAGEDDDLPQYYAKDIYDSENYYDDNNDDEDGDDNDGGLCSDDEEDYGGQSHYGRFRTRNFERVLPEYAEDEREPQVYVA
ncbi:hypothetical protein EDD11_004433 [Mortierella claussenii]|nr:hypothetical protein EDD11_004433 [Mortierella claussenii]